MILWKLAAFLFPREGDNWVAALRLGAGIQLVLYCLSLRHDWNYIFAGTGHGLLSRQLSEIMVSLESPIVPRLGWLVEGLQFLGLSEKGALTTAWVALLIVALGLTAGFFTRTMALLAWFLHLCVAKSGGLLSYGVDNLMTIALFYLMWCPFPDGLAVDAKIWPRKQFDLELSGFLRRMLQLHLCLIYFFGGLAKALGNGWWNGENIWRALTRAPFDILPTFLVAKFYWLLPAAGVLIWTIEIGYAALIWPKRTRLFWLGATCAMHVAIGVTMGMYLFAAIMIVLNLAAFLPIKVQGR